MLIPSARYIACIAVELVTTSMVEYVLMLELKKE
jgi:hypothetical protein